MTCPKHCTHVAVQQRLLMSCLSVCRAARSVHTPHLWSSFTRAVTLSNTDKPGRVILLARGSGLLLE